MTTYRASFGKETEFANILFNIQGIFVAGVLLLTLNNYKTGRFWCFGSWNKPNMENLENLIQNKK